MSASPVTLNNGTTMPSLGLGIMNWDKPELTQPIVEAALDTGYRLLDTAAIYGNERDVGAAIAGSGVPRSDIFLTTKLWMHDFGREQAMRAFEASIDRLKVDYIDLYLLHWPVPAEFDKTIESYQVLIELQAQKRVRSIGVANFSLRNLTDLISATGVVPAVNQIEVHPFFSETTLCEENAKLGIVTEGWAPLGASLRRKLGRESSNDPLAHPVILELAARYGKTPAQIILRWHIENNVVAIPKTVTMSRLAENFDVFDFSLLPSEVASISALDTGMRPGPDPQDVNSTTFNRRVPD